jgi:hypothetical protein
VELPMEIAAIPLVGIAALLAGSFAGLAVMGLKTPVGRVISHGLFAANVPLVILNSSLPVLLPLPNAEAANVTLAASFAEVPCVLVHATVADPSAPNL